jgi:hypothetical protein
VAKANNFKVLKDAPDQMKLVNSLIITVPVMAFAQVSAPYKDPVGSVDKAVHEEHSVYSTRAHHSDYPDVGRVLKTRHPRRISGCIATPVAQKAKNPGFKFVIGHCLCFTLFFLFAFHTS